MRWRIQPQGAFRPGANFLHVFDREALMDRMGDKELLGMLVGTLGRNVPKHLEALRAFHAERDAQALASEAHRVKGAVANFESPEVTECALTLEKAAEDQQWDEAQQRISQLEGLLEQLQGQLKAFVDEG